VEACPYCGESIKSEARLCRHCNRNVLYEVWLEDQLNDRGKYEFVKSWKKIEDLQLNCIVLPKLSEAKDQLKKMPLLLAWNLNAAQAGIISSQLKDFPIAKRLQSPLTSASPTDPDSHQIESSTRGWLYGTAFLIIFAAGIYFSIERDKFDLFNSTQSKDRKNIGQALDLSFDTQTLPGYHRPSEQPQRTFHDEHFNQQALTREDVQRLMDASVFIQEGNTLGSGFFISSDGYILTNHHVVSKMSHPEVLLKDGRVLEGQKIKEDPLVDLALIKVNIPRATYLEMGDANELYAGQDILTIGNPSGLSFTVTRGIVSYVGRPLGNLKYIQTDAAINPGNSGGPMITHDLKVVAINTLTAKIEKGISFSVPINYAFQTGGVAQGIGDKPDRAGSFMPSPEVGLQMASLDSTEPDGPDLPVDYFQQEAQALKAELARKENDWKQRLSDFRDEETALMEEMKTASSDMSQRERVQRKLDRHKDMGRRLNQDLSDLRVQYIRQVINILQRQKVDSRFTHLGSQIDAQIEDLQRQKKQLEESVQP